MKRRAFVLVLAVVAAVAFAGCGNGGTLTESKAAEVANPWTECTTIDEAELLAGFDMDLPDMSDYGEGDAEYRVMGDVTAENANIKEQLRMIEVQYPTWDGDSYVRKAFEKNDISGDYNAYKYDKEIDGVTYKGDSEDKISLATWTNGDYSYSISLAQPVSLEEMKVLVGQVK